MSESVSWLPIAAFLVPLAAGTLAFLARRRGRLLAPALALLGSLTVAAIAVVMSLRVAAGEVLTSWGNELRVDGLSALLVAVIGGVGLLTSVYAVFYVRRPELLTRVGTDAERRLPAFYGLLLLFLGTMVWGCVTNNIIMLYVAVEATTLTSGLLVAFYWDRRALEAGYKYLMLLTIGITFALFGCVAVYAAAAATGQLGGREALLISEVAKVARLVPSGTALLAVAFLIAGFGTKAGIAPFHPWLPDAHAEAPTPVSALLSGVMIKMALYALARTVSVFYPGWSKIAVFVVALGVFSMLVGILMALAQDDLKRLLAYSSVSQIGYVLVGIGLGTYLGCYGGAFHLLNHALEKALLFLCVGAVIYATGGRRIAELGGLAARMPITGGCFVVGALGIAGFPLTGGFMSKLTIFLALGRAQMWWAVVLGLLATFMTAAVMLRAAYRVFWGSGGAVAAGVQEVPPGLWVPMLVLAGACVVLGVFPQAAHPLLDRAATALTTLGR
ncbi:MAG TPA: proton-conducting transporter membrane subunit [Vicinamibacteria bacterium]|nr:proton-conducting transporter membrane subunit [Vicinamibacteria bacterium]